MLAVIAGIIKWRFSSLQKFIYIQGKPRSGKGTFIRLITEIIGGNNVESSCLNKLSSEYEIAEIIDSQLVVFPDEDKQGGGYSVFKKLTGGDELRYRQIYKSPAKASFEGSILISSNGSIFAGDTSGIPERQCILIFDNQISEKTRSPLFEERLHRDIDKLLAVALTMPDDEIDARIKGLHDGNAEMYRQREWELKCDVNGVAAFIEEYLKPSKDGFIASAELFEKYNEYCDATKYGKTHIGTLSKDLINIAGSYLRSENVKSKSKRVNGESKKVITGIAWRDNSDPFPSQEMATNSQEMAQGSEPLRQAAVTDGGVTAEALRQETTENQGIEPSVTAVTAASQTFLSNENQGNTKQVQTEEALPESQPTVEEEAILESQPTVEEVAQDLLTCESSERLTVLRECYDRQILQEAAKLLNSQGNKEKVKQIADWVKVSEDDLDPYKEAGLTEEEVMELYQAFRDEANADSEASPNHKPQTQPNSTKELKVGSWTSLSN